MNKQQHILLVGSRAFAKWVLTLFERGEYVDVLHSSHVTIDLFLAKWRPDCAVVNCDDLEHELLTEIEALSCFRPKPAIVLVSSSRVSRLAAAEAAALLLPSEVRTTLAPLVRSLFTEDALSQA